jgi:hypothetical protein
MGNKVYPNYRLMTQADIEDIETRARLIASHQQSSGWPLFDSDLDIYDSLCVFEGELQVNSRFLWPPFGLNMGDFFKILNVYSVEGWVDNPPLVDFSWTIEKFDNPDQDILVRNFLFVSE